MSYASLAEFKQFLGGNLDATKDVDRQRALDSATAAIDDYCGRTFGVDAADVTQLYYPNRDGLLDVVDLVSITTLKVDSHGDRTYATTLAPTDYELLPYNAPRYDQIRIWPTSSKTMGPGRLVQIVGKFGYTENGAVPAPVVQACLILANRFASRAQNPFGILQTPDIGQYTRISKEDPDMANLLKPYSRGSQGTDPWVVV